MSEWQPITTAPKDGGPVLVLEKGQHQHIAFWWKCYSPFYRAELDGWWTSSDPSQAHLILPADATHWMPLPELPAK